MREGFHWDAANGIRKDSCLVFDAPETVRWANYRNIGKYAGTRHYFLKDLQQPPRWIVTVQVNAKSQSTLCRFDLSQLSRERIQRASAASQIDHKNYVYGYQYCEPDKCFNAVYDDMLMEGWWPWPRKVPEVNKKEEIVQEVNRKGWKGVEEDECCVFSESLGASLPTWEPIY
jgi:hypothetical protein